MAPQVYLFMYPYCFIGWFNRTLQEMYRQIFSSWYYGHGSSSIPYCY